MKAEAPVGRKRRVGRLTGSPFYTRGAISASLMGLVAIPAILVLPALGPMAFKVDCRKDLRSLVELLNEKWSFLAVRSSSDLGGFLSDMKREARGARTAEACADVIARFLERLDDGQAALRSFPGVEWTRPAIDIRSIRERLSRTAREEPKLRAFVVARDTTDASLQQLLPGSEIIAIDGVSIDSVYAYWGARTSATTPQWRDYQTDKQILLGQAGTAIELEVRAPKSTRRRVVVLRPVFTSAHSLAAIKATEQNEGRIMEWRRLDGGWGYIKVYTFASRSMRELVSAFDSAMDSLLRTPGLILDLRGNSTGQLRAITDAAGRMFSERQNLGSVYVREPGRNYTILSGGRFTTSYIEQLNEKRPVVTGPRKETYQGPVVLLIDAGCFSACELLAAGLQDAGRATLIGSGATGGGSGYVSGHRLPSGAIISFSETIAWRETGQSIERNGVRPDMLIRERSLNYYRGRDVALLTALRVLERGEAQTVTRQ